MFFGRERELQTLEKLYSGPGLKSLALLGRRRVGKTALLNEFCKGKRTIYFSARESSETINLDKYSDALSAAIGMPMGTFKDFEAAMEITAKHCENEKTILVIDELPFLAEAAKYFPSTLQHYMDHGFSELDLFVIICGSSIGMMDELVNGRHRPLFGRFSRQMRLEPFDYITSCVFSPEADNKACAEVFSVTGGIPQYLRTMTGKGFKEALIESFLSPSSPLKEEPANLIRQEFKYPSNYLAIIHAIAGGNTQINQISAASGVEPSTCSKYVSNMESVGIVRKETPMSNSKRRPVYEISDGLFRFRYAVVEKAYPFIVAGDEERAYESVMSQMPRFMGKQFEEICRQYVRMNTPYVTVGKWWGNDPEKRTEAEIDIVASDGYDLTANALFGSCKYRTKPMDEGDLDELVRVSTLVKGYKGRKYALFSLSGFTDGLRKRAEEEGVMLLDLDGIYSRRTILGHGSRTKR